MALNYPNNPVLDQEWTDPNGTVWKYNGEYWRRTIGALQGPPGDTGPEGPEGPPGTTDHPATTNRDAADQHPISAITGLQASLDLKLEDITGELLGDLSDVSAAAPATDDVLKWNGSLWVNGPPPVAFKKNRIINGNFDIWQRGTSFTTAVFTADRWLNQINGSANTVTRQAFTVGQTDVPGNPDYYIRNVVTSSVGASNYAYINQAIESVKTFAGETVTVSFYAKADAPKNITVVYDQFFGTGGSPSGSLQTLGEKLALTTSWAKYTITTAIPSISGKTIGTNNDDALFIWFWFDAGSNFDTDSDNLGHQSGTFDIAQVQIEPGDTATDFEYRHISEEEALCQRYFYRITSESAEYTRFGAGWTSGATYAYFAITHPVTMRTVPSLSTSAVSGFVVQGDGNLTPSSIIATGASKEIASFAALSTYSASGIGVGLASDNNLTSWLAWDAEL